jgi:hypothetical protein
LIRLDLAAVPPGSMQETERSFVLDIAFMHDEAEHDEAELH